MAFVGSIAGYSWGIALALSLTSAAIISFFVLRLSPKQSFEVGLGSGQRRTFKGGVLTYPLLFRTSSDDNGTLVELINVPEGVKASLEPKEEQGRSLTVSSKFAGVFKGFSLKVGIGDPLGLFNRYEGKRLELAAEFLPTSLLSKLEGITVNAAMLGDRPAGTRGSGQEFYTAELYDSSHDSKGILWRRQAMLEGDKLMVRVGEANIPEMLTVCLIEEKQRGPRELPGWMDLASEAISIIGVSVIATGSSVRVIHQVESHAAAAEAKDITGLADLLAWLWRDDTVQDRTRLAPEDASIIVTGKAEIENRDVLELLLKKPSVVLSYSGGRVAHGANVVFFTGKEDIGPLVNTVLSR